MTTINTIKPIFITLLVSMLLTVVAWGQSLDKGTYTITNTVLHDNPVGQGMARSYTEEKMDVEINDNGTYVTLGFNNTQFMGEFTIKVDGSTVAYDVVSNSNNIKKLKFKVPSLSSKISVGMFVVPMDTTVEYTVTLNSGSLTLVKKAETPKVEEPKIEEPKAPVATTETQKASDTTKPSTTTTQTEATKPVVTEEVKKVETVESETNKSTQAHKSVQSNKSVQSDKVSEKVTEQAEAIKTETTQTGAEKDIVEKTEAIEQVEQVEKVEATGDVQGEITTSEEDLETETLEAEVAATNDELMADEVLSEDNETKTSSSSLVLLVVVGVSVVIAAIGLVVYFKRK